MCERYDLDGVDGTLPRAPRGRSVCDMSVDDRPTPVFTPVDPESDAARWCLAQYYAELNRRFEHGFDVAQSLPTDRAELVPPRGAFLVGTLDREWVACGALKAVAPGVAYFKRMWVADGVRGRGIGRLLLSALEAHSVVLGFHTARLETNRALTEAIAMYRRAGYVEVAPFNDERYAHHWFEKALSS
jgi:GNAT superfamily N-acetyltransferase